MAGGPTGLQLDDAKVGGLIYYQALSPSSSVFLFSFLKQQIWDTDCMSEDL